MRRLKDFVCKHYELLSVFWLYFAAALFLSEETFSAAELAEYQSPLIDYGYGSAFSICGTAVFLGWLLDLILSNRSKKKEVHSNE